MPLFEYCCRECEQTSEILLHAAETPRCAHCGSDRVQKQMSHITPMSGASGVSPCRSCRESAQGCPMAGDGCGL